MDDGRARDLVQAINRLAKGFEQLNETMKANTQASRKTATAVTSMAAAFEEDGPIEAIAYAVVNRPVVGNPEAGDNFYDPDHLIETMAENNDLASQMDPDEPSSEEKTRNWEENGLVVDNGSE